MEYSENTRIWRYMDFAKFASLLATRSLYFACPSEFNDPYEAFLPRSDFKALSGIVQRVADDLLALRPRFAAKSPTALARFDDEMETFRETVREAPRKAASKFGVSSWHISEWESEAMWKLYAASGKGIAIESTAGNLRASLGDRRELQIDAVRYRDFDKDPIERGHQRYLMFVKKKCYEHEKELRATILLPQEGVGTLVQCDLDVLVNGIHVSPLAEGYVRDAIEAICCAKAPALDKPVLKSTMLAAPDYGIEIDLKQKAPLTA